jgi:transposase
MSPDMSPIEHAWDFFVRKMNKRNPQCENNAELTNVILEEWRQFSKEMLRRLDSGMNRRVQELWSKRGGYTRY